MDIEHADGEGWGSFYFECGVCGHKQAHVYPLPCMHVECTRCGTSCEVQLPNAAKIDPITECSLLGWYDVAGATEPAHDPGFPVPCPYCDDLLYQSQEMKTISFVPISRTGPRSYFYRAHKQCYVEASAETIQQFEGSAIDVLLAKEGDHD